mgnify:CR=1 FL=1
MPSKGDRIQPPSFDAIPFRGIVEQSLVGIYVVQDERIVYANERLAQMYGYAFDDFVGIPIARLIALASLAEVQRNYRLRISGEVPNIRYVAQCVKRDGGLMHLDMEASHVEYRGRPALAGVAIDITERVRRQEELQHSREQFRALAQRINSARETERARLARDVHDVLGGMLTSAKMDLSRIVRRSAGQPELQRIAVDLVGLLQQTIDTARAISDEMHPASLGLLGLPAALRQVLDSFGARHAVAVSFVLDAEPPPLPEATATQIYRIVQEGLTNVARHAQASRVELRLRRLHDAFELRLADDGRGIDAVPRRPGSIGLFSMAERAREIGATATAVARAGGGTEVVLRLPLPAEPKEPTP